MIGLYKNTTTNVSYVVCPFCYFDISFVGTPPPHCPKCHEEVPPWHDLVDNVEDRADYYYKHPAWDYSSD